jgi:uncharacterized iron-regulated membrane protein
VNGKPFPRLAFVHRWLGVGLGLWFMAVGLTGALLVWRDDIDAWLNPQWLHARDRGPPLDLETLVDKVRHEHGLLRIERIRLPLADGQVVRLQVRGGASRVESARIEAFVDPGSGALLGRRGLEGVSFAPAHAMRNLYDLHRNLLLGEPGSNVVGIAGFLLMSSAITGLVVAWPRTRERWRRLVAVSWRANATRVAFDLHRSGGVLIGAVLLLATATGATLVYLNYVRDLVSAVSRVEPIPVLPFRAAGRFDEALTLSALAERVHAAFPAHRVAEIRLPERGLTGVTFQLHRAGDVHRLGDTIAWLHPFSGELLAERSARTRSAGEAFMHWLLPLHVGSAFGTPGLVAMCAAGMAPLLLAGTGLLVWWRKRPGERIARERAAARHDARRARRAHGAIPPQQGPRGPA